LGAAILIGCLLGATVAIFTGKQQFFGFFLTSNLKKEFFLKGLSSEMELAESGINR
jgi:hypothetical protein